MDAEQVGEDSRGDGAGEFQHRGAPAGLAVDTELGEALTYPRWGDRLTGQVSGEQPVAVGGRGDAGVSAGCIEVGAHESG